MLAQELVFFPDHQFGGRRRRRSAQVGDKIGDGEIGLMTDRRNDRNTAVIDGLDQRRFIEGPQVLVAAPAPAHDQDIHHFFNGGRD